MVVADRRLSDPSPISVCRILVANLLLKILGPAIGPSIVNDVPMYHVHLVCIALRGRQVVDRVDFRLLTGSSLRGLCASAFGKRSGQNPSAILGFVPCMNNSLTKYRSGLTSSSSPPTVKPTSSSAAVPAFLRTLPRTKHQIY